jgi:hypothetical protein
LVIAGTVTVSATEPIELTPGRAVYVESGDRSLGLDGHGLVVVGHGVASL